MRSQTIDQIIPVVIRGRNHIYALVKVTSNATSISTWVDDAWNGWRAAIVVAVPSAVAEVGWHERQLHHRSNSVRDLIVPAAANLAEVVLTMARDNSHVVVE